MTEKIPQHKHCRQCGKAFIGKENFCSVECTGTSDAQMKKKKRQLLMLYVFSFMILILMVVFVGLGR